MSTILSALLGPPNTRAHTPEMMELGLRKIFGTEFSVRDKGYVERVYNMAGSKKKTESDVVTAALGLAVATPEGAEPTFDAMQEVYKRQYTHTKWTLGCEFTEESIEDNLYWDLMQVAGKELATSMNYTRTVQAFDIFNDLTLTIYNVANTNYGLLSTAHFMVNGDTYGNTTGVATGLSLESLELYLQQIWPQQVDQRGRLYDNQPALLHVSNKDEFLAHRLLMTEKRPTGANNDVNAIKDLRDLSVFVNYHLNRDGRHFIHASKENTMLVYFDRVKAGVRRFDNNPTGNRQFVSRMRNSHGASGPLGIVGVPGS